MSPVAIRSMSYGTLISDPHERIKPQSQSQAVTLQTHLTPNKGQVVARVGLHKHSRLQWVPDLAWPSDLSMQ